MAHWSSPTKANDLKWTQVSLNCSKWLVFRAGRQVLDSRYDATPLPTRAGGKSNPKWLRWPALPPAHVDIVVHVPHGSATPPAHPQPVTPPKWEPSVLKPVVVPPGAPSVPPPTKVLYGPQCMSVCGSRPPSHTLIFIFFAKSLQATCPNVPQINKMGDKYPTGCHKWL